MGREDKRWEASHPQYCAGGRRPGKECSCRGEARDNGNISEVYTALKRRMKLTLSPYRRSTSASFAKQKSSRR